MCCFAKSIRVSLFALEGRRTQSQVLREANVEKVRLRVKIRLVNRLSLSKKGDTEGFIVMNTVWIPAWG